MEELRRNLRKGETLLWESGPKRFPLLESKLKGKILGEWIVTLILAAWLLYVERDNANFGMGVQLLVAAVAFVVILSPIVEYYSLKRQKYYLTDQRAIVVTGDNAIYYMDYDKIGDTLVIDDVADGRCIAMGEDILADVIRQLRWRACHPKTDLQDADTRGQALGMVFYLPDGADQAIRLMKDAGVALAS